jgi:hypothetical protein
VRATHRGFRQAVPTRSLPRKTRTARGEASPRGHSDLSAPPTGNGLRNRTIVAELDSASLERAPRKPSNQAVSSEAEGEGFEPSIRLTTDNGFRDRLETIHLQGFCIRFATRFASRVRTLCLQGPPQPATTAEPPRITTAYPLQASR